MSSIGLTSKSASNETVSAESVNLKDFNMRKIYLLEESKESMTI